MIAFCCNPALAQTLPGTEPLEAKIDFAREMVEGIHRYLDRELAQAATKRRARWKEGLEGTGSRQGWLEAQRKALRQVLGATDPVVESAEFELMDRLWGPVVAARDEQVEVYRVRWRVLEGVHGEGLLVIPLGGIRSVAVVLPDADQTPEQVVGLYPTGEPAEPYARELAERGIAVLVPALISRCDTFSGRPGVGWTNQPHREFIFRMAYEIGRHILGYEIRKVEAGGAILRRLFPGLRLGLAGYGEGGLVALFAAALDPDFEVVGVSGCIRDMDRRLWEEPIYRSAWRLLRLASNEQLSELIAPRELIVVKHGGPVVEGPPPERNGRRGAAPGRLEGISSEEFEQEAAAMQQVYERLGVSEKLAVVRSAQGKAVERPFPEEAQERFAAALMEYPLEPKRNEGLLWDRQVWFSPDERERRQFEELVAYAQRLVKEAEREREEFWKEARAVNNADEWAERQQKYRNYFWEEIIGKLPEPTEPMQVRSRLIHREKDWEVYEVLIPVYGEVFAYGLLVKPITMNAGERRPVVVVQHGLEGRPQQLIFPENERQRRVYKRVAVKLVREGFIVYAPQNPYIGGDHFRQIVRKGHPLGLSLFSFIVRQHERTLKWLKTLPFVDGDRIGFYGLSYGGKTAMRVPAILSDYVLSICSADFNDWIRKVTEVDYRFSYMYTQEYDMLEFGLGRSFNYGEMAWLIAPGPFMVERGHNDPVGIDEWVAAEYAKVRRFYDRLGIGSRTAIEFFNGEHEMHLVGTLKFLKTHLQ